MAKSNAQAIADDILKLAKRRKISLKPIQLVKLVYIAYGWYLALYDERLFMNRIEAWKYGPVVVDLYKATKHFGRDVIPHDLITDAPLSNPDIELFLDDFVEKYGELSGIMLSHLTHKEGTPWRQMYERGNLGKEISNDLIAKYYKEQYDIYPKNKGEK